MEKTLSAAKSKTPESLIDKGVRALALTLYYMGGFVLSGAGLFFVRVPFCVGLAAACSGAELVAVCAGSITGCFLRMNIQESLVCLIPLTGAAALVCACEKLRFRNKQTVLCTGVFIFTFAASTILLFSAKPSLNGLVLNLCASALCAGSVVFYKGAVDCIRKKRDIYMLDNHSLICIMMSLCTLLLGCSEVSIMGLRPARLFGSLIIIAAASLFSQAGGSIAGVSIGTCLAVSGTSVALSLCYGICGLASGIFSKYGQLLCSLVFSGVAGVFALIDGSAEGLYVFIEAAVAGLIFSVLPSKQLAGIRSGIERPHKEKVASEAVGTKEKLAEASRAVGSVSRCIRSVSNGIEAITPPNDVIVCLRVKERVCTDCKLKNNLCPENGEFAAIMEKLSQGNSVSAEDFSANFNQKCPSAPKLAESFNRIYSGRSAVNALQAGAARNREFACGQFEWASKLLKELADGVENGARVLHGKERTALRVLTDRDFEVLNVACTQPSPGAICLKCSVAEIPPGTSLTRLTSALSAELEVQLNPPGIREIPQGKELTFMRKEILDFRFGCASASCGNRKLCGDYFECFRTDSKAYVIMSDGMGTGGRAAIDSAMTVEIFSRLIKAGIGLDTALGFTNIALAVKSEDESLSTLDVAEIDLFSGETQILKAGAAPSFYTCSGRVRTVEPPSIPLGILNNVGFSKYTLKLRGGDMLVMASDGMLGSGSNWLRDEIKAARNPDAREFSELLLETARRKCGKNYDDMTVVTLIMEER